MGQRCKVCGEEKAEGEFYASRRHKSGRLPTCKVCARIQERARYRKRNPPLGKQTGAKNPRYTHGLKSLEPSRVVAVSPNVSREHLIGFAQQVGDRLSEAGRVLAAEVGGYVGHKGELLIGRLADSAQQAHVLAFRLTGEDKRVSQRTAFERKNSARYRVAVRRQAADLGLALSQCESGWAFVEEGRARGKRLVELDPTLAMMEEFRMRSMRAIRMIQRLADCLRTRVGW